MQLLHVLAVRSVLFDEPNVVAHAGLVSAMMRHHRQLPFREQRMRQGTVELCRMILRFTPQVSEESTLGTYRSSAASS